ncbi:hypothetical protein [Pectobacterium wasabiae]|uniref:Uncharacterized protein n=1 Tax=Pectobacterium wasabiae TaxID=55208 RepID=A0AAW3EN76_9GAMM|nr:hypothetical protein [Pectobacterium wasabiae]AOR64852.1 hypothetical protein A7983_16640 [Pectobacterium wasabiae CFBP 3304]EJS96274.1 Hypothetical protein Y17_0150 [Pectobacterium wasabiae CFBP 3304]KFX09883.1 hypothetical protein JV38_02875 [Pectobacterium wasabiae]KGA30085.1 hypothetical protein KU73_06600 [Pectobacterium wasabiae]
MSKKTTILYYVMVTFDITVGDKSNIYSEVSDLLEKNGLTKDCDGNELPENVYFGTRKAEITYEGEVLTQEDIKARGVRITKRYYDLLKEFFNEKKIKYKIFITASRKSTTAIRYTISKK